jgi:hypothetical protein
MDNEKALDPLGAAVPRGKQIILKRGMAAKET